MSKFLVKWIFNNFDGNSFFIWCFFELRNLLEMTKIRCYKSEYESFIGRRTYPTGDIQFLFRKFLVTVAHTIKIKVKGKNNTKLLTRENISKNMVSLVFFVSFCFFAFFFWCFFNVSLHHLRKGYGRFNFFFELFLRFNELSTKVTLAKSAAQHFHRPQPVCRIFMKPNQIIVEKY